MRACVGRAARAKRSEALAASPLGVWGRSPHNAAGPVQPDRVANLVMTVLDHYQIRDTNGVRPVGIGGGSCPA